MSRGWAIAVAIIVAVAIAAVALSGGHAVSGKGSHTGAQDFAQIERGRYLAVAADCQGCHTVPGSSAHFAGGRPIETPFGIVAAPNITPDRETGIGAWSDKEFDNAVRRGHARDGSLLYPAMPYPYYAKFSKTDVLAIRAYLSTVKPVVHGVVANRLPFPLNIRKGMLVWNALYFSHGTFKPDPAKSPMWNRGAYLVEGAGHCGACHTPKTWFGGDVTSRALQGGTLQGWFAPDITNNRTRGLGNWSMADIVGYLKTGHNRITAATGTMAEEVELSTARLSVADITAIAAYLKSLGNDTAANTPLAMADARMKAGAAIYADACSACHASNGKGVPNLFPSLAESANVRSRDATTLIRIVLRGAASAATKAEPTAPAMPSFAWQMNDQEIADVLTYIRNRWGMAAPAVAPDKIHELRTSLASRNN